MQKIDLKKYGGLIKKIFYSFSTKESIKFTGASKVLHLILPNLFMMWDKSIREAYHKLHSSSEHSEEDCYLDFLHQTQGVIRNILREKTEKELWKKHIESLDKNFSKRN